MKLNEITSGNVWLIIGEEDYEATVVTGIYSSEAAAKKDFDDSEKKKERHETFNYKIIKVPLNKHTDYDWLMPQ